MYTINDPMFALILRFVGKHQKITFRDDEFIRKQLTQIRKHVARFPPKEQELRACEWIEKHAQEYRETWEKDVINQTVSHNRCPDCPLAEIDDSERCQIHDDWLELLELYAAHQISSKEYVESALELLAQHKENLKVKLSMLKNEQN